MATSEKTSAANGVIYAATSGVTASAGNIIAEFQGRIGYRVAFASYEEGVQERFATGAYYGPGQASIWVERLVWDIDNINLLWDITKNASGTLNDGSTAATTYTIAQDSKPQALEVLFQFTSTGDGKKIEFEAGKVFCPVIEHIFEKGEITSENILFDVFADGSNNVLVVRKEN